MKKILNIQIVACCVGVALLLSGCASKIPQKAAFDSLTRELDTAARTNAAQQAKGKSTDVTQSLLPPLLTTPGEDVRRAVEPRFDLAVSNASAAQVFMAIVSGTRYSMLVHPDVKGDLTVNLKNVTVKEALDTLRDLYGFEYKQEGTRISILPNTLQTHFFQVNYLAAHRQGMSDMRVTSGSILKAGSSTTGSSEGSNPPGQDSSQLTTVVDNNFWPSLWESLCIVMDGQLKLDDKSDAKPKPKICELKNERNFSVNPLSGVVLVRGMPADIRNVKGYLEATQLIVERQVMLEAKILEVELSEGFQTGVNWAAIGTGLASTPFSLSSNLGGASFPTAGAPLYSNATGSVISEAIVGTTKYTGNAIAPLFLGNKSDFGALNLAGLKSPTGLAFQTDSFVTLLNFLESQGNIQVLSSPRIATLNNQKAVLKVGYDDYYVTGIDTQSSPSTGTGTTTNEPVPQLSPLFSGIALDVTPQIDDENNIVLHVHPSISTVRENLKTLTVGGKGFSLPMASISVNETDSIVRVQDGNIVAIGGLFTQEQSNGNTGLPGASGKSFWGDLFGQRSRSHSKREVVFLIKPTIIQNAKNWDQGLDEVRGRLSGFAPRETSEPVKP